MRKGSAAVEYCFCCSAALFTAEVTAAGVVDEVEVARIAPFSVWTKLFFGELVIADAVLVLSKLFAAATAAEADGEFATKRYIITIWKVPAL